MSRRVCKNILLVNGCPHHRQGLKSLAPHTEIETGKEMPGKTGSDRTALGSTIPAGKLQINPGTLIGGLAVMGTENETGRCLGNPGSCTTKSCTQSFTVSLHQPSLICSLALPLYVQPSPFYLSVIHTWSSCSCCESNCACRTGSHSHEQRRERDRQYEGSRSHGGRR